jgi:NADPH2:quinone reductase
MPGLPKRGRSLRSTITSNGMLQLRLIEEPLTAPTGSQVLVAVEATPINPSDLGVLLGPADPTSLTSVAGGLDGSVPARVIPLLRDRLDRALPIGNEGAGTVIAAGPDAPDLVGRRVALIGGAMWSDYRLIEAGATVVLPDDATAADGAAMFVNPMTALAMVETMRAENHTALVHTAAASNLGQMLVKICQADGVGLVNVVRSAEQAATLGNLGAEYVVDSSLPDFADRLAAAIAATHATLGFDAVGGGTLAGDILAAMERAVEPSDAWTPYGSTTHKQIYLYGSLDPSPTTIRRTFGMRWSVGGFLLTDAMVRLPVDTVAAMRARVLSELKTTFASAYAQTIGLAAVLDPAHLTTFAKRSTGSKYLINPSLDRSSEAS